MTPANDNDPMTGKQINNIRIAAGMSWRDLAEHLSDGDYSISAGTLRKKMIRGESLGPDGVAKLEALERKLDAA